MQEKGSGTPWDDERWIAERAIVLQVLRNDRARHWTRAELRSEIYDIAPEAIRQAIKRLEAHGVLCVGGREIWASKCAHRLDMLGMVSI